MADEVGAFAMSTAAVSSPGRVTPAYEPSDEASDNVGRHLSWSRWTPTDRHVHGQRTK